MKKLQIGVIGSMADVKISGSLKDSAREIGREIAEKGHTLVFSFEGDFDSLPQIAAHAAAKQDGQTVAFILGSQKPNLDKFNSIKVVTGQQRGGGREFSLILSCNVLIALGGESGTLMEIAIAYQANIPVIVLRNSKGWSQKLAGTFLDERNKAKIISANSPKDAVAKAIKLGNKL